MLQKLQELLEESPLLSQEFGSENTDFEANSLDCSDRHLDRYCEPCSGCSDPFSDPGVNTVAALGLEGTSTDGTPPTKAWRRGSVPTEGGQESETETSTGQINYYDGRSPENDVDFHMFCEPRNRDVSSTESSPQKQKTDWFCEQSYLRPAFPETCFKIKDVCEGSGHRTDYSGANADPGDIMQQVQPADSCSTVPETAVNTMEATQQQDTNTHSKGSLTRNTESRRNVQAGLLRPGQAEGHTALVTEGRETPAVEGLEPPCERGLRRTDKAFQSQQKPMTCLTLNQSMSDSKRRSALYVVAESIQNSSITCSDMSKLSNISYITSHHQQNDVPEHVPKLKPLSSGRSEELMSEKIEMRHAYPSAEQLEALGSQVRDQDHVSPEAVKGSRLCDSTFELNYEIKKEKSFQTGSSLKSGHLIVKTQREAKAGSCMCHMAPQEAQCSVKSCSATEDSLTKKKVSSDTTAHVCSTIKQKPLHPHKTNPFISTKFKHEGDVIISSCKSNPISVISYNMTSNFPSLTEDDNPGEGRWIEDQDSKLSVFAKINSLSRMKCLKAVKGDEVAPPPFHIWSEFWLFEQEPHKNNQDCGAFAKNIVFSHPGKRGLLLRLNETEKLSPTVHARAKQGSSWVEEGKPNAESLFLEYVEVALEQHKHSLNLSSMFESPSLEMKDDRPPLNINIDSRMTKQLWKINKQTPNVEKQKMTFLIPEQDCADFGTYPLFDRITTLASSFSPRTLCNGDPIPKWDITQWRGSENPKSCRSSGQRRKCPPAAQCPSGLPLVQTSTHVKSDFPLTSCSSVYPSQSRTHTPAQERLLGHPFLLSSSNPNCCEPAAHCPLSTTASALSSALHGALLDVEEPTNSPERPERMKPKPNPLQLRFSLLDASQKKIHSHSCMSLHGSGFISELEVRRNASATSGPQQTLCLNVESQVLIYASQYLTECWRSLHQCIMQNCVLVSMHVSVWGGGDAFV